jgi:hypothetical protein
VTVAGTRERCEVELHALLFVCCHRRSMPMLTLTARA